MKCDRCGGSMAYEKFYGQNRGLFRMEMHSLRGDR